MLCCDVFYSEVLEVSVSFSLSGLVCLACLRSLTLGAHAQRGLRYLVCVCVSVTQHLTFHVIVRVKNDNNLLSGG